MLELSVLLLPKSKIKTTYQSFHNKNYNYTEKKSQRKIKTKFI